MEETSARFHLLWMNATKVAFKRSLWVEFFLTYLERKAKYLVKRVRVQNENILQLRAVVVSQSSERLLPTRDDPGSNLTINYFIKEHILLSAAEKTKTNIINIFQS